MDLHTRLRSAEQQSFELHKAFSHVEHRLRELKELQNTLGELHTQLNHLRNELSGIQGEVQFIQKKLPSFARKEELDRISKKIDTIPFETMLKKTDLSHDRRTHHDHETNK